jgi:hypothetical protein
MQPRLALNSSASCLHLPSAGIAGGHHHPWLISVEHFYIAEVAKSRAFKGLHGSRSLMTGAVGLRPQEALDEWGTAA